MRASAIPSHWGRLWSVRAGDGSAYYLKERGGNADLDRQLRLLRHLRRHGQPVAPPLLTRSGLPGARRRGRLYCLFPALPGTTLRDRDLQRAGARTAAVAEALAGLHRALSTFPRPRRFPRLDLASRVLDEVLPAVAARPRALPVAACRRIGRAAAAALAELRPGLPEQLVHGDAKPSNLLWEDGAIRGIVDFDVVANSVRLFDPCYFALTLLRKRWAEPRAREAWPALARALLRAWARAAAATGEERRGCAPVLLGVQLDLIGFNLKLGDFDAARRSASALLWLHRRRADLEPFAARSMASPATRR